MTTFLICFLAASAIASAIIMWRIHTTTEEERIANAGSDVHSDHAGDDDRRVGGRPVGV